THDFCLWRAAFYRLDSCRSASNQTGQVTRLRRHTRLPAVFTVDLQRLAFVIVVFWRVVVLLAGAAIVLVGHHHTLDQLVFGKPGGLLLRECEERAIAPQLFEGLMRCYVFMAQVDY